MNKNGKILHLTVLFLIAFLCAGTLLASTQELKTPSGLTSSALSCSAVELRWSDNSRGETGHIIEVQRENQLYTKITVPGENKNSYVITGLPADSYYNFRVKAIYGSSESEYSNTAGARTLSPLAQPAGITPFYRTVLRFYLDIDKFYIKPPTVLNDLLEIMDASPVLRWDRTFIPVKYVLPHIGATVTWTPESRMILIRHGDKTIKLWIDNPYAEVNGTKTPIDASNLNVTPLIVPPGRTVLPLRFIAENLGCQVDWNAGKSEITITYPK